MLMADPNWKNGFYYDGLPPHAGMKLARRESRCSIVLVPTADFHARDRHHHVPFGA